MKLWEARIGNSKRLSPRNGRMNSERETIDHNWLPNAALFSKMKIVVIDDEPANIALLEAMLAEGGYSRVKTVTDSRLAMETCLEVEPDLVLLD
ncbi:MAG: hypothetical protein DME70_09860, partial [Verrucomicrobia bacterium]